MRMIIMRTICVAWVAHNNDLAIFICRLIECTTLCVGGVHVMSNETYDE